MKKKILLVLTITLVLGSAIYVKKTKSKNNYEKLININNLSEEFMDDYFEKISETNVTEEKENMIIVTSENELKEFEGAKNVIEAPNNQYILQYDSKEEKEAALEKLKDSNVSVTENTVYKTYEDTVLVSSYNSWGVEAMGIDTLLNKLENKELNNVVVAILDTGLDVDLFNKYYPGRLEGVYNVLENNQNMYDDVGHGTHIAGTIAESTPNNVKILSVKISLTNEMYLTDILAGINYVTRDKKVDVINMSYGSTLYTTEEYTAIEAAKNNNIISVAAAGNENRKEQSFPAGFTNTISIAAVDSNKEKASFSNYGKSIMFAAPGVNIKSLMREGTYYSKIEGDEGWDGDSEFETMNGTSMATPHVVSAVANLKSLNKNLSLNDSITILRRYSEDLGETGWDEIFGYGFINFDDAEICDGENCDEYNVFKTSTNDDLDEVYESYEIEPVLSQYDYGNVTNVLGTKIKVKYTNDRIIEYELADIDNLEISEYDPSIKTKQTINIRLITPLGVEIEDSFDITNPSTYESVWEYTQVGNNNIEITGYKATDFITDTLIIPSTIDGYTVTGFADKDNSMFAGFLWNYFKKVRYIYLPSTLTKIGNNAFSNRITVTSSDTYLSSNINVIKSSAEKLSIGDNAFRGNNYIYEIDANISYIGDYGLSGVVALQNIKFSDDITHIGTGAFQSAMMTKSITIPKTITEIGENAFAGDSVSKITFLNSINTIPNGMFQNNWNLESLILPDSVTIIDDNAFYHCSNLVSIRVPRNLTTIGNSAFEGAFKEGANTKTYIFENVTSIGTDAFKNIASDAKLYVYNNSNIKSYANTNNINYVQIDPDNITVHGINSQYHAFDKIDMSKVSIELTYNEKVTRIENITDEIYIEYTDDREEFRYGDTLVTLSFYNSSGYPIEKEVQVEVLKVQPNYEIPKNIKARTGQKLSEVELPANFEWMDTNQSISESGNKVFKARYIPDDTINYETIENIDITILVDTEETTLIIENYQVENGIINGIPLGTNISNLNLGLDNSYTVKIKNNQNEEKEGKVATGDYVEIYQNENLIASYRTIIKGDITGTGTSTISDVAKLYQYLKGKVTMDDYYVKAGNVVDSDNTIKINDVAKLYQYIKGKINNL